jgi:chromosome segregation ATPase
MLPSLLYDFNTYAVLVATGFAAFVIKFVNDGIKTMARLEDGIKSLKEEIKSLKEEIKSLKEEHECAKARIEDGIKSLNEEHECANARHEDGIKSLKEQRECAIKSLEESPTKGVIKREGALTENIEEKLKDINVQHECAIKSKKEERECAIKSRVESIFKDDIKRKGALIKNIEEKLKDMNAQHEDSIKSLKKEHGDAIKAVEDDIKSLEDAIKSLEDELEIERRYLRYSEQRYARHIFEGKQIDANVQHEDGIKSLKEEHGDAIKSFEESLNEQREGANNEEDEGSKSSLEDESIEDNLKDFYKALDRSHRSLDKLRLNRQCYEQRCDIADLKQDFKQRKVEVAKASKQYDEANDIYRDLEFCQKDTEILKEGVDNVLILCEETWKSMEGLYQELREMNPRTTDEESIDTVESLLDQLDL